MKNSITWGVKCEKKKLQKIVENLLHEVSKIVHEWNGHLEICSRRQAIENSRHYLLPQKTVTTVVGCP